MTSPLEEGEWGMGIGEYYIRSIRVYFGSTTEIQKTIPDP